MNSKKKIHHTGYFFTFLGNDFLKSKKKVHHRGYFFTFLNFRIMHQSEDPEESDNESSNSPLCKKIKRQKVAQKFRQDWLSDDRLKYWLEKDANDQHKAKCKLCLKTVTADLSVLLAHRKSTKHENTEKPLLKKVQKISKLMKSECHPTSSSDIAPNASNSVEKRLTDFFVEHNMPLDALSHLMEIIKSVFTDSKIVQEMIAVSTDKKCFDPQKQNCRPIDEFEQQKNR